MKEKYRLLFYFIRFYLNKLRGQALNPDDVRSDKRYKDLVRQFEAAFQEYNPGDRDYLRGIYTRKGLFPPDDQALKILAAELTAEVILIVDLMNEGRLAPTSFKPLIAPLEIEYYQERIGDFLGWMVSEDPERRKMSLPFFYSLASELQFQMFQATPSQKHFVKSQEKESVRVLNPLPGKV